MTEFADLHCHSLPGVDDGAKNMDETREMLREAYEEGLRCVIFTPHDSCGRHRKEEDLPQSQRQKTEAAFARVQEVAQKEFPELVLYLGSELFYGPRTVAALQEGQALTMARSHYVLVEFFPDTPEREMEEALRELLQAGFWVILAHVERYEALRKNPALVEEWIRQGVYLQANAQAILGAAGGEKKRFLKKLLKKEQLHFVATDAHNRTGRPQRLAACGAYLEKKYGAAYARRLLWDNPGAVIEDVPL